MQLLQEQQDEWADDAEVEDAVAAAMANTAGGGAGASNESDESKAVELQRKDKVRVESLHEAAEDALLGKLFCNPHLYQM